LSTPAAQKIPWLKCEFEGISQKLCFFPVDNTKSGSGEPDPTVKQLSDKTFRHIAESKRVNDHIFFYTRMIAVIA